MAEALRVREVTSEEWSSVATQFADFGFEQSATYGQAGAQRIGAKAVFIVIEDAEGALAAAHLRVKALPVLGRGIAWAPGGPMLLRGSRGNVPLTDVLTALKSHVSSQGHILRLRLPVLAGHDPEDAAGMLLTAGFQPTGLAAGFQTILVDLSDGEEALLKRLHGKWRNALRSTWKAGVSVEIGDYDDFYPRFRKLYDEVQGDKGFDPDISPEFYLGLKGADFKHKVLIATLDGEDIATITVGLSGTCAVYLFGATGAGGRKVAAGNFLTWEGYQMARSLGMQIYDLGGIDAEENPHVFRFKDRAGGWMAQEQAWEARSGALTDTLILTAERVLRRLKKRGG